MSCLPWKKFLTLCLSAWGEGCTRAMTRDVTRVISLMTVGWVSTYQPLEFCQRLAAEQPLPGQAVRTALSEFHHGTNNSFLDTLIQLIWTGRRSAQALYLSASLLSVQCTVCTVFAWACTDVRRARTETSFVMRVKPIEKYKKLRNCGLNQQLYSSCMQQLSLLHWFSDSYPHHMQSIYPSGTFDHGGTWSNRTYVALALFSLLTTCVAFWSHRRRDIALYSL
jgi:hypothetical protein